MTLKNSFQAQFSLCASLPAPVSVWHGQSPAEKTHDYPGQLRVNPQKEVWITYDWNGERAIFPGATLFRAAWTSGELFAFFAVLLAVVLVVGFILLGGKALWSLVMTHRLSGDAVASAWKGVNWLQPWCPVQWIFWYLFWPFLFGISFLRWASYPRARASTSHHSGAVKVFGRRGHSKKSTAQNAQEAASGEFPDRFDPPFSGFQPDSGNTFTAPEWWACLL